MPKSRLNIENLEECPRELLDYAKKLIDEEILRRHKELLKEMPKVET